MKSLWKPVKGYEGRYEVSPKGKIRSLLYEKKKILKEIKHYRYNYVSVSVYLSKTKGVGRHTQVSRVVALAFIPNVENKLEVNHIDNDATNNKVENLEWVTHKENMLHCKTQGRIKNAYTVRIKSSVYNSVASMSA